MRALSVAELLEAWERGLDASLAERMLILLGAACQELSADELRAIRLGRRDALLMELRGMLFGSACTVVVPCPECGEQLESTFSVEHMLVPEVPDPGPVIHLQSGDVTIAFRVPSSGDLIALAGMDTGLSTRQLLSRCIVEARGANGSAMSSEDLPDVVVAAVSDGMAAADPQADMELMLACSSCGTTWSAPFDIASFLWIEIDAWAQQLLRDVHLLASAYGWRESDVLTLSPLRRSLYLELIRS